MSRNKKPTKSQKQRRGKPREAAQARDEQQELEQETVDRLFCSTTTAIDATHLCELRIEDAVGDAQIARLYHEVWTERGAGPARELAPLLTEVLQELDRHQAAMGELARRLDDLATDASTHDHLAPAPDALARVRRALDGLNTDSDPDDVDFDDLASP